MNRQHRRSLLKEQRQHIKQFPSTLTLVPRIEWPSINPMPSAVWRSRQWLVQLYDESAPHLPGLMRLSVIRAALKSDGHWQDGITWDELQTIKREVGFADWWAVEVYPRDRDLVNVSNMRHLWLLPVPLRIGWFPSEESR